MKKLVVIQAGLSDPSTTRMLAERIADSVTAQVSKRGEGVEVAFVDIANLAMDVATVMSTGIYNERLREAIAEVNSADAVVAATPVFSASYSGLFKMFIDVLDKDSLTGVPVIIAATAGTARHSLVLEYAMRPLFTYLRAVVMPTSVFAATDDFGEDSGLGAHVARAARELAEHLLDVNGHVAGFGPDFAAESSGGTRVDANQASASPSIPPSASSRVAPSAPPRRRDTATQVSADVTDFATLLAGHDGKG